MMFYHITQSGTYLDFAQFGAVGSWSDGTLTPCCQRCTTVRIPPLQIMWIPGSDLIGDFSWGNFTTVIQTHVAKAFASHGVSCCLNPVEHIPYDGSAGRLKKKDRIVQLPYSGPLLQWLFSPADVHVNRTASRLGIRRQCDVCGHVDYEFRRTGLVIAKSGWNGQHIFRVAEFGQSDAMFVTEFARTVLADFSNIKFALAGEIT